MGLEIFCCLFSHCKKKRKELKDSPPQPGFNTFGANGSATLPIKEDDPIDKICNQLGITAISMFENHYTLIFIDISHLESFRDGVIDHVGVCQSMQHRHLTIAGGTLARLTIKSKDGKDKVSFMDLYHHFQARAIAVQRSLQSELNLSVDYTSTLFRSGSLNGGAVSGGSINGSSLLMPLLSGSSER